MYFVKAKRTELLAEDPKLSVTETAKATGAEWRNLTDDDKAPYVTLATDDKARHAREMAVYVAAGGAAGPSGGARAASLPPVSHPHLITTSSPPHRHLIVA